MQRHLAIPIGVGPIVPPAAVCDMPWVHYFTSTSDGTFSGYTGTQVAVRVNNAYEPCSSTHQPYGWDQMTALYRQYKVIGCKMEVTVQNSSGFSCITLVRPVPVNENTNISNVSLLSAERPDVHLLYTAPGAPIAKWSQNIDIPRLCGVTREQYEADVSEYAANYNAAPNRFAYVQIATQSESTSKSVVILVKMTYRVQFWQRSTQATS